MCSFFEGYLICSTLIENISTSIACTVVVSKLELNAEVIKGSTSEAQSHINLVEFLITRV